MTIAADHVDNFDAEVWLYQWHSLCWFYLWRQLGKSGKMPMNTNLVLDEELEREVFEMVKHEYQEHSAKTINHLG